MGGILNNSSDKRSWPLLIIYSLAIIGGAVLVYGFSNFDALHQQFLAANFNSVQSARTLFKARLLVEQAAHDIEMSAVLDEYPQTLLQNAHRRLRSAEHYAVEGDKKYITNDVLLPSEKANDSESGTPLATRIVRARTNLASLLSKFEKKNTYGHSPSNKDVRLRDEMQSNAVTLQRLAQDIDAEQMERWDTLSIMNKALGERRQTMHLLLIAAFSLFAMLMLVLAWALLRTRHAENALISAKRDIEAVQQTTLDASPIGIAFVDTVTMDHRSILTVNQQMAEIFRFAPTEMPGMPIRDLYSDIETYNEISKTAPMRLSWGDVMRVEVLMKRKCGETFWCAMSFKAIDHEDIPRGMVLTCEDISKRKAAEIELQQERARAEEANKTKSEFLANMSHELRTPATGLFGLLDLLDRSQLDEQQKHHLALAHDCAEHMQNIVNDILDFSKIEAGKLLIEAVPFDLRELVENLAKPHMAAANMKGLHFGVKIVEPLADTLCGDPMRIRQVINNLLSNALKFTPQGEVLLSVETINDRYDPTEARHSMSPGETTMLRVSVEDTGVGIAFDKQMRIFDKFTQADSTTTRKYGGTGLGLAICSQLAKLMEGHISLSSNEGKGSCFTLNLRLPVTNLPKLASPARSQKKQNVPVETNIEGSVIVLADDNKINRGMLAETLGLYGATVWATHTGFEAVRLVEQHRPDVVLMDCQMPGMDGFEATRRIRANETPDCHQPIIALTAFATSTYSERCLAPGMMDRFFSKPVNIPLLLQAINELRQVAKDAEKSAKQREKSSNTDQSQTSPTSPTLTKTAAPKAPENVDTLAPLSGRILLVEDNLAIREATRLRIAGFGCEIDVVGDGPDALKRINDNADDYDLVLMDCKLVTLDGCETTRRWRKIEQSRRLQSGTQRQTPPYAPLPIIAVTADDRPEAETACRSAGMDGMLIKPYNEAQLYALLADWLT